MSTQTGTALLIGFDGHTYSGVIMENVKVSAEADVEAIKGEDNATTTKIISDPKKTISFSALITGTSAPDIAVGDTVAINSVSYFADSAVVTYERGVAKLDFAGTKEASMTYS